jgi:heme-degrading monooxygenase HmoA
LLHPCSFRYNRCACSGGERAGKEACLVRESQHFEGFSEQIDEGLRYLREEILPTGKDDPGFKGLIALGDRQSGKTLSITLWDSEEDVRATEQDANQLRSAWAETSGQEIASIESYEVGLFEVES